MTNYKLVDGDIVGLGISHDSTNPQINVTSREYYIMKVKVKIFKLLICNSINEKAG